MPFPLQHSVHPGTQKSTCIWRSLHYFMTPWLWCGFPRFLFRTVLYSSEHICISFLMSVDSRDSQRTGRKRRMGGFWERQLRIIQRAWETRHDPLHLWSTGPSSHPHAHSLPFPPKSVVLWLWPWEEGQSHCSILSKFLDSVHTIFHRII
jgi:hypothetical protein